MIWSSSYGSLGRKRLSDITNMNSKKNSPLKDQENVLNNYVQQLLKENAVMMKLIQEKDKIINSNGVELRTLRVNLQSIQLQNQHLAQSNTQMLTEFNTCKDRLKVLQHELACQDTLHKFKLLDLQEKEKMHSKQNRTLENGIMKAGEIKPEKTDVNQTKLVSDDSENRVSKTKRPRPMRSRSLGPPKSQQAVDKETSDNKRRCLRRQSGRLSPEETPADLFEIYTTSYTESLKQPVRSSKAEPKDDKPFRSSKAEPKDDKEPLSHPSKQFLPQKRSSIGRPVRRAAEKIQSYKDPPLGTKLRRP